MKSKKGLFYVYSKEKADEYRKLSPQQKLEWLEKMGRFLYYFMPNKSKLIVEKLRSSR